MHFTRSGRIILKYISSQVSGSASVEPSTSICPGESLSTFKSRYKTFLLYKAYSYGWLRVFLNQLLVMARTGGGLPMMHFTISVCLHIPLMYVTLHLLSLPLFHEVTMMTRMSYDGSFTWWHLLLRRYCLGPPYFKYILSYISLSLSHVSKLVGFCMLGFLLVCTWTTLREGYLLRGLS